jgi:peroxiredoxin
MALSEKLDELRAGMARLPDDIRETMLAAQAELISSGIAEQALGVGDTVPDFDLPNQRGETVSLTQLLSGGPVVISFYRGGWCPYCNLELRALQEKLPEITDLGARLLAVTPELPDNAMSTAEKNAVRFDILSDVGNRIASAFGLVFHLPASLRPVYEGFGLDLVKANGDDSYTLPIPATYVVDTDRKILAAHVDMDYSQRMEPEAVIAALAAKS